MPALDLEEDNNTTTRLLTLLNVSALKSSKRKRTESIEPTPRVKLNKRRSVQVDATESISTASEEDGRESGAALTDASGVEDAVTALEDAEDDRGACGPSIANPASADRFSEEKQDPYEDHFGAQSSHLSPTSQSAAERNAWKTTRLNWRTLGPVTEYVPDGSSPPGLPTNGNPASVRMLSCQLLPRSLSTITQVLPRLKIQFESSQEKLAQSSSVKTPTIVSC